MSFGMMASFVPAKIGRALSAPLGADICDVPGDKCN
jgi:hypothetical protein